MDFGSIISGGATLLGFGGAGAATGAVFSLFNGILGYFQKRADRAYEIQVMQEQRETLKLENDLSIKLIDAQKGLAIERNDGEAFTASISAGNQNLITPQIAGKVSKWMANYVMFIEATLRTFRAFLTVMLMAACGWSMKYAAALAEGAKMSSEQAFDSWMIGYSAVIYMTAMCIGWWFGDRAINRMLMQRGK
jgi:hypothetical protein